MSSSAGDAGSSSAEATNFEDYNTTSSYSGYDEAGISTPTLHTNLLVLLVMMKQEQQHHLMLLIL